MRKRVTWHITAWTQLLVSSLVLKHNLVQDCINRMVIQHLLLHYWLHLRVRRTTHTEVIQLDSLLKLAQLHGVSFVYQLQYGSGNNMETLYTNWCIFTPVTLQAWLMLMLMFPVWTTAFLSSSTDCSAHYDKLIRVTFYKSTSSFATDFVCRASAVLIHYL
jgi:hypothetical protein